MRVKGCFTGDLSFLGLTAFARLSLISATALRYFLRKIDFGSLPFLGESDLMKFGGFAKELLTDFVDY